MANSCRGWDRDEKLRHASSISDLPPTVPMSSFTPINQNGNNPRTVTPQGNLLNKELDSDSLYNLEEDDSLQIPSVKSKKRPNTGNGLAVSFTKVWEYEDDGDLAHFNNGPGFEEALPPKRRKAAPKKRAQSMKIPAMTLENVWERVGEDGDLLGEPAASQLATPPGSRKHAKSRTRAMTSKRNPKIKRLFQNQYITKPSVAREKKAENASPLEPVRAYQGFTTTEAKVKTAFTTLSKMTLEKLAAFGYKPSIQSGAAPRPVERVAATVDLNLKSVAEIHQISEQPLSSYGPFPSNDSSFKQATWHFGVDNAHLGGEYADFGPINAPIPADRECTSQISNTAPRPDAGIENHLVDDSVPLEACPQPAIDFNQGSHSFIEQSEDQNHYDEPTSREGRLLHSLLQDVDVNVADNCFAEAENLLNEPPTLPRLPYHPAMRMNGPKVLNEIAETCADQPLLVSPKVLYSHPTQEAFEVSAEIEDPYDPSLLDGAATTRKQMTELCVSYQFEIERSDLDDYEIDAFDEGIDDEDFLAIVPDLVVPETPKHSQQPHSNHTKDIQSQPLSPASSDVKENNASVDRRAANSIANRMIPLNSTSSPPQKLLDSDDEYPVDEEDEVEWLKLPEPYLIVPESFDPPATVQETFSEDKYNDLSSFSPPVSPTKVAESRDTDRSSASRSPRLHFNGAASPIAEEEDYSFMNTDSEPEVQIMSDPLLVSSLVPPRHIIDISISSPTKRTMSAISRAETVTTQRTAATSALSIIDDSHEYEPLLPFARPEFPPLVMDRCPVIGLSAQIFLRTCFRIGEMFQVATKCHALGLDAVIELFARVNFSSRESGTSKQHFQFLDLWHDRPPLPNGVLPSFKTTGLVESESNVFLNSGGEKKMARVLGRLKKDMKKGASWSFEIINIRETDWEEIKWTRRIVSGDDLVKKGKKLLEEQLSKLRAYDVEES